jgi:hypothetical protein
LAIRADFDDGTMWVELADGRKLGAADFPRLLRASPTQRSSCVISGGGTGLHWEDIDEDILVSALLLGFNDRPRSEQLEATLAHDRQAGD